MTGKQGEKPSAEKIKAAVIDWLLDRHSNILIGNEVMYGSKRKVVDLLAIIDSKTIAIEIKSASDKLIRLPEQMEEYSRIFDKIVIIAAPTHISNISKVCKKGVGLYSIDKTIKRIHAPLLNHNLDKLEMLSSISSAYLKKMYPHHKALNENELRLLLSKEKKEVIHQLLISFYQNRLSEKFSLFLSERGNQTLVDDIPTLSTFTLVDEF